MSKSCRVNKELLIIQLLVASYSSFLLVSMLLRSAFKCFTSNYFGKTIVRAASSPSNIPITYFTMRNLLQRLGVLFFFLEFRIRSWPGYAFSHFSLVCCYTLRQIVVQKYIILIWHLHVNSSAILLWMLQLLRWLWMPGMLSSLLRRMLWMRSL